MPVFHPKFSLAAAAAPVLAWASLFASAPASSQTALALDTRALAASCASCHGTDGQAVAGFAMPKLAGLPKDYLVAQMQAFISGSRPATVMQQIAKGYSAAQIDALATYFAARK